MLLELKRSSYDIGIFGKKGSGKTMVLTLLGYINYKMFGSIIFSNYNLTYPYQFIESIEDLNKIYQEKTEKRKIFLGDDLERWFHSYSSRKKLNKDLNQILMDFGKLNCSTYYTSKRSMAIDIGLRETTSEFWFPEMYMKYKSHIKIIDRFLHKYLNFMKIKIVRYDENLEKLKTLQVSDLSKIANLYDTKQIIRELKIQ